MNEPLPKRTRTLLTVTISEQVDTHSGWLSRTLRLPMPQPGRFAKLRMDLEVDTEECPDDVETLVLNPVPTASVSSGVNKTEEAPANTSAAAHPDQCSTVPYSMTEAEMEGILRNLDFHDHEKLYQAGKPGRLLDQDAIAAGGPGLVGPHAVAEAP